MAAHRKKPGIDIPWDEKTSPGPVPGPAKLTVPWDEAAAKLIGVPPMLKREERKKPKGT
ncbi:MAG TPA: hypothetical protein VEX86_01875 [Longimicrobium sp.]|nr:hypothetical protein [Longimicrobium sp.]